MEISFNLYRDSVCDTCSCYGVASFLRLVSKPTTTSVFPDVPTHPICNALCASLDIQHTILDCDRFDKIVEEAHKVATSSMASQQESMQNQELCPKSS